MISADRDIETRESNLLDNIEHLEARMLSSLL